MSLRDIVPKDKEIVMREEDFIVSKTDLKGRITYGNQTFIQFSGFEESQILGIQHNVIRHPDMPRAVFKLLWGSIQEGKEIFCLCQKHLQRWQFLLGDRQRHTFCG